jgi:hypothetical protein
MQDMFSPISLSDPSIMVINMRLLGSGKKEEQQMPEQAIQPKQETEIKPEQPQVLVRAVYVNEGQMMQKMSDQLDKIEFILASILKPEEKK